MMTFPIHSFYRRINHFEEVKQPYKAIVFSQFKTALYTIGDKIIRRALQKYNKNEVANSLTSASLMGGSSDKKKSKKSKAQAFFESTNVKGYKAVADYQYEDQTVRDGELARFQNDPDCNVLLLGQAHTDGLDLSFATDIFVVDEVRTCIPAVDRSSALSPPNLAAMGCYRELDHNMNCSWAGESEPRGCESEPRGSNPLRHYHRRFETSVSFY